MVFVANNSSAKVIHDLRIYMGCAESAQNGMRKPAQGEWGGFNIGLF